MEITSRMRTLGFLLTAVLMVQVAVAQQADYDPEYDEEAAGSLDYSDEEAAGSLNYSDAEAAGEAPQAEGEVDMDGNVEVDESLDTEEVMDDEEDDDDDSDASERSELKPWKWGAKRHLMSLNGASGLYSVLEAGTDDGGTFGVGFHGSYFKLSRFIFGDDVNTGIWGGINLRVTPIKYLEIFLGLESRSNYNTRGNPKLFQTLGDFTIGLKGNYSPLPVFTAGLIFAAEMKNPVGEVDVSFKGTSLPLGLLTTFDFAELNEKTPLRFHLNFIYRFDNSAKLVADIEKRRGGCAEDVDGDGDKNFEGCLDAVERYGLNIDRTDQFRIGVGIDAAFPFVTPLVEYNLDIPINRQETTCANTTDDTIDSCMKKRGFKGMRQWLSLGLRFLPPLKTLSVDVGVDIGVAGYAPAVHELSPTDPYRVIFGLTYNFDPFVTAEPESQPIALPPPPPELPPPPPFISGYVYDSESAETPVPGATITYVGQDYNAQVSDETGRFRSYDMPVGRVTLLVKAEGYEDATVEVDIPDPEMAQNGDVTVQEGYQSTAVGAEGSTTTAPVVGPQETPAEGAAPAMADGTAPAPEGTVAPETGPPAPETAGAPQAGAPAAAGAPPDAAVAPSYQVAPGYNGEGPLEIILNCPLKAKPKKGTLLIRAEDNNGNILPGTKILLKGPSPAEVVTNETGEVTFEVDAGSYTVTAEKVGYFKKVKTVEAQLNTVTKVKMSVASKPQVSSVVVSAKRIAIKKKVHFETNSDEIKLDSHTLLSEVAEVLLTNPSIKLVQIQGHTDNKGKKSHNIELSQKRADSVRRFLIEAGVNATRLEAKGFGPNAPIAPNITGAGRARNRRVEFHIKERAE